MQELGKMRLSLTTEEDKERRQILDLLEEKKLMMREVEELKISIKTKVQSSKDYERRYE